MFSNPLTDPNWAERVTNLFADFIEKIRSRTTQPLIYLARAIVFGIIAVVGVVISVAFLLIGLTRLLQDTLDTWFARDTAVWASYFIIGGIFMLVGMILMKKRYTKNPKA